MSTTAMSERTTHTTTSKPGFGATLASEWTKMVSVRSTYIMLALTLILSVGMTALVSLAVGTTWSDWSPQDRASFDPIGFTFVGLLFGQIVLIVFGVMLVTSEYSSKMMPLSLIVTPQRGRLMAAKLLLVTVVTMLFGVITMSAMFYAGQMVFGLFDMPTASLFSGEAPRAIIGTGAMLWVFPIIGACLGFLLRSTAGAITATLGILWLPSIIGGFLPSWWQENIIAVLPSSVTDALTLSGIQNGLTMLDSMPLAAAILVGWLVLFVGGAYLALGRRDA